MSELLCSACHMSPDTSNYQYIKYQHPKGLPPGSGKVIGDLDFFIPFSVHLFSSEHAFLWLIKIIIEVKRKKSRKTT